MAYSTWTDDKGNTFSEPYIPKKIVGFHGIDPDLVGDGGGGGSGIDDHEQLKTLLGGDNINGHWHITAEQWHWLMHFHDYSGYAMKLTSIAGFNALVDARIAEYMANNQSGGQSGG